MPSDFPGDHGDRKKPPLVLASASETRIAMLTAAGLAFDSQPARVDEETIRRALEAESAKPRDIADVLAETKALKISGKRPDALVIGSDQVLELDGQIFAKPENPDHARDQLMALRGKTHRLLSAVVVCRAGEPLWRHMGEARLTMRDFSEPWLDHYIPRNWEKIRHSVGGYRLEEEGIRLFSSIQGDHFTP
ncbi:Maf family protein, partial [Pseudogemmobacter bohemicus]|uniref:Maf family protein n=1 Tax=Pseudogemmobacter bohemicus TaxID=2250708 RepID=UPI000DD3513F